MAVGLKSLPVLQPIAGVRVGTARAGIKTPNRRDLLLVELAAGSTCAATFTRNAFCAAPVTLARRHLAVGAPRYWLINSGNANAGTGGPGLSHALACCEAVAERGGCPPQAVLPFSTGVIGEPLPVDKIRRALPDAFAELSEDGWAEAAAAIMTTDTVPKGACRCPPIGGQRLRLTGIVKGAGMIRPDMATLLAFLATDAAIPGEVLQAALSRAVDASFNRISVDGDTSTNDACAIVASGQGQVRIDRAEGEAFERFYEALESLCIAMAQAVVRDGEGATRFITVEVQGGADAGECDAVAFAIAHSPLVKTAFYGRDPNWGRILAAVGRAGLEDLDLDRVEVYLDEVRIVSGGGRDPEYRESLGQRAMEREDITVRVLLHRGEQAARVWTCDLSHEYVTINAEYRT